MRNGILVTGAMTGVIIGLSLGFVNVITSQFLGGAGWIDWSLAQAGAGQPFTRIGGA